MAGLFAPGRPVIPREAEGPLWVEPGGESRPLKRSLSLNGVPEKFKLCVVYVTIDALSSSCGTACWESIRHHLMVMLREGAGREASSTAVVVDTQSAKTTESGGPHGWDATKRLKRRKLHVAVDKDLPCQRMAQQPHRRAHAVALVAQRKLLRVKRRPQGSVGLAYAWWGEARALELAARLGSDPVPGRANLEGLAALNETRP